MTSTKKVNFHSFFQNNINRMIFLMFFCVFLYNLGHPATPALIELRNWKKSISGVLLALMSCSMFISSPYLGSLADHVGMKKIFKFMPLIYGSAQLIFGFSPYLSFIYLARIVSGFASGGTYAVAFGYVSQISSKEEKAKNIAKVSSAAIIGGAIGQKVGGLVALIDPRYSFGLQFICGIIAFLLIFIIMKEIKSDKFEENSSGKTNEKKNLNPFSTFTYIKELDPFSKFFCFIIFLTGIGIYTFGSSINYFLKFYVKVSSNTIGTFVMFSSLTAFFGTSVLLSFLLKKYKELILYKALLFIGIILMGIILFRLNSHGLNLTLPSYILMALYTMTYEIVKSLGNTIIAKNYKYEQGKILGVASAVSFLGNAVGSLLSGYILSINSFLPFIVNIVVISIVLILLIIFHPKMRLA